MSKTFKYMFEDGTEINYNQIMLNNNDNNDNNNNNINICLISNEPLTANYVSLKCGHSFNYLPLYKDVINCKKKNQNDDNFLKFNEIKCPYCRKKHQGLLPFIDDINCEKKHGINFIDNDKICCYKQASNVCYFLPFKKLKDGYNYCNKHANMMSKILKVSEHQNTVQNDLCIQILKSGLRKGEPCGKNEFKEKLCKRHYYLLHLNKLNTTQNIVYIV
jgi:hypothetical protein